MGWFTRNPAPHVAGSLTAADVRALLPMAAMGKLRYAPTSEEYLLWRARETRFQLSKQAGVFKWASTATCTLFSARFVVDAAQDYFNATFHATDPASALAVFDFWYKPAGSVDGHAIVGGVVIRDGIAGLCFVDVQAPADQHYLTLSEIAGAYNVRLL
jgi:hypothetical protein